MRRWKSIKRPVNGQGGLQNCEKLVASSNVRSDSKYLDLIVGCFSRRELHRQVVLARGEIALTLLCSSSSSIPRDFCLRKEGALFTARTLTREDLSTDSKRSTVTRHVPLRGLFIIHVICLCYVLMSYRNLLASPLLHSFTVSARKSSPARSNSGSFETVRIDYVRHARARGQLCPPSRNCVCMRVCRVCVMACIQDSRKYV